MSRLLFEFTESAIKKLIVKFTKTEPELNEDEIREYLDKFDRFKRTIEIKDPFQYKSFNDLKIAVDNAEQKRDAKRGKAIGSGDYVDNEDIIADDENVTIYMGDTKEKCIKYGKHEKYGFCIADPTGNNAFYQYYTEDSRVVFYFIYFKKRVGEIDEILVLGMYENGNVEITYADNNTHNLNVYGDMKKIYSKYPELLKYKSLLVFRDTGDASEAESAKKLDRLFTNIVLENKTDKDCFIEYNDFNKASYNVKLTFLQNFKLNLPLKIFELLDKRLRNAYITNGPNLNDDIYNLLTESEKKRYNKERRKLYEKYSIELIGQISNLLDSNTIDFIYINEPNGLIEFNIKDKFLIKDLIEEHNNMAKIIVEQISNSAYVNVSIPLNGLFIDKIPDNLPEESSVQFLHCMFLEKCHFPRTLKVLQFFDCPNIKYISGLTQVTSVFIFNGYHKYFKLKDIYDLNLDMEGLRKFDYSNRSLFYGLRGEDEPIEDVFYGLPSEMFNGSIDIIISGESYPNIIIPHELIPPGVRKFTLNGLSILPYQESFKQYYYSLYG